MDRLYSTLVIKAVDEDRRIIRGIASTPEVDRVGDIVVPEGAQYNLPIPFLWQHDRHSPIGNVTSLKVGKKGIEFEAQIESDDEPGPLKDLLDLAWRSIQKRLVRFTSIGFKPLESADIDGTWGQKFTKWEFLELSAVTIPANASAAITSVKQLFDYQRAASGTCAEKNIPASRGSVSIIKPEDRTMKKTIAEQIKNLQETRKVKADRLAEITELVLGESRTKDASEREEFDTLKTEIDALDAEVKDLKDMEKMAAVNAKPVDEEIRVKAKAPASPEAPRSFVQVKNTQKLDPGIGFARYAKCLAISHNAIREGRMVSADQVAKSLYPHDDALVDFVSTKAAVAAAVTTSATWAGNLITDGGIIADFVEYLRPQTIIGRFGTGGIPSLRRVPFRRDFVTQTGGGAGYWVGEGQAKPLTAFSFTQAQLSPYKVANIAVASMEMLRDGSASTDTIIRDALVAALRERLDIDFIDPAKAVSAGVSPASITNGATTVASSGTDADAVRADIQALFATFNAANNAPTTGVFIMPATTALALSLMQNPLGQAEFPGISMNGGTLFGLPVIISEYVPSDTSGAIVALVNASDIYLADEGGFEVKMSTEASLQMDDAPDNPTTASTVLVSLWQRNLVGFLAERTISWARRRTGSVAYLTGVLWGSA